MTPLEKRQEAMRQKHHAQWLKKMRKWMAKATPAEKLDRMEELAYRIARRKWQKCL